MDLGLWLWEHAHVHSAVVAPHEAVNIEDLVCDGLAESDLRVVPPGQANSIVWLLWHMARSEDVGINVVLDGGTQVLNDDWCRQMAIGDRDIGTGQRPDDVLRISEECVPDAVRAYRQAVGSRTRDVAAGLTDDRLANRVPDDAVTAALELGALHPSGGWVADFWRGKQGQFFLWLGTGHNYMHLQEASVIRSLTGRGFGL
jgi:hypothetical protein